MPRPRTRVVVSLSLFALALCGQTERVLAQTEAPETECGESAAPRTVEQCLDGDLVACVVAHRTVAADCPGGPSWEIGTLPTLGELCSRGVRDACDEALWRADLPVLSGRIRIEQVDGLSRAERRVEPTDREGSAADWFGDPSSAHGERACLEGDALECVAEARRATRSSSECELLLATAADFGEDLARVARSFVHGENCVLVAWALVALLCEDSGACPSNDAWLAPLGSDPEALRAFLDRACHAGSGAACRRTAGSE